MHQKVFLNSAWETGSIEKTLVEVFITPISRVRLFSSRGIEHRKPHKIEAVQELSLGKESLNWWRREALLKLRMATQPRGESLWGGGGEGGEEGW